MLHDCHTHASFQEMLVTGDTIKNFDIQLEEKLGQVKAFESFASRADITGRVVHLGMLNQGQQKKMFS